MEGDNDGFVFVKDKRKCFRQKTYVNENDKARMYSMHSETNKSPDVSLQRKLVARIESARCVFIDPIACVVHDLTRNLTQV